MNICSSKFKDLYFKIFLQLDFDSLKSILLTCKKFNQVINSNLFCKLRLSLKFPTINIEEVDISNMKNLYRYLISRCKVVKIKACDYSIEPRFSSANS